MKREIYINKININNKYDIEMINDNWHKDTDIYYSLIDLSTDKEECGSYNVYSFILKAKQYIRITKQLEKQLIKEW